MIRTKTTLNLSIYPAEIIPFLAGADIYDSSCSEEARVYFSDKDQGYFLKEAVAGFLKPGLGVEFCVSDIRQSQEWRCRNRAEKGLNALLTSAPEAQDGMRASA